MSKSKTYSDNYFIITWFCLLLLIFPVFFLKSSLIYKIISAGLILAIAIIQYKLFTKKVRKNKEINIPAEPVKEAVREKKADKIDELDIPTVNKTDADNEFDNDFIRSINVIVQLVRDHYSATNSAVYWYNNTTLTFKILTSTDNNIFKNKFHAGEDIFSMVINSGKPQVSGVMKDDRGNPGIKCYRNDPGSIKSIMLSPLFIDNEAVGLILCDSKLENYFDIPNLDSFKWFAGLIENQINLYSLKEEYDFERYASGIAFEKDKVNDEHYYDLIRKIINRFLRTKVISILTYNENLLRFRSLVHDESINYVQKIVTVDKDSLAFKSIENSKFLVCDYSKNNISEYRFSPREKIDLNTKFCSLPIIVNEKKLGVITFETDEFSAKIQNVIGSIFRLVVPIVALLYLVKFHKNFLDTDLNIYGRDFFYTRLNSEIIKSRNVNDNSLICVYVRFDNFDELKEKFEISVIEKILLKELKAQLNDYDMIFKLSDNQYALLISFKDDDLAYVEFERIRKEISSKIFEADTEPFTTSISFAIKRYNNFDNDTNAFTADLDKMLIMARNEGGNITKIY